MALMVLSASTGPDPEVSEADCCKNHLTHLSYAAEQRSFYSIERSTAFTDRPVLSWSSLPQSIKQKIYSIVVAEHQVLKFDLTNGGNRKR